MLLHLLDENHWWLFKSVSKTSITAKKKHKSSAATRQTLLTGVNKLGVDQVGLIPVVVPKGVNNDRG